MIFRRDPCGLACVVLIYAAIGYAEYALVFWMVLPTFGESIWGATHIVVLNTLFMLVVIAHARTMFTDPGIVPISKNSHAKNRRPNSRHEGTDSEDSDSEREMMMLRRDNDRLGEEWSVCTRCETFRPPRAHHCRICKRCIRKMDHHCPWVNNCVGEYNQKFFLQFLFYVALSSTYSLLTIVLSWAYHNEYGTTGAKGPNGPNVHHAKVLHTIVISIESALFGMFVIAVSCDQLQAIWNDETAVEAVQRRGVRVPRRQKSSWNALSQVCGYGGLLTWLLPCSNVPHSAEVVPTEEHAHFTV